jgi:glucans biosynthesis protein
LINGPQRKTGALQFVVDFKGIPTSSPGELPVARAEASAGAISAPIVQPNPEIDGLRVSFSLDPKGAATSELRLVLLAGDTAVSDTWVYRWTKD